MFKRNDKSGTRLNVLMIILCIALVGGLGAMWYYNHQIQSVRREELKALSKSNTTLDRYFPQEGEVGLEESAAKENADKEDTEGTEDTAEESTVAENFAQGSEQTGNSAHTTEQTEDSAQPVGQAGDSAQSAEQPENPDPAQTSSSQAENTGI